MTILYTVGNGLYVNTTNRCPCACTFCIRNHKDGINEGDYLWLEREPTVEEICNELKKKSLSDYSEVVFCGYGEPSERIDDINQVIDYIRSYSDIQIRIDTNGLANLIYKKDVEEKFSKFDVISISLNGYDSRTYYEVTKPKFGIQSFDEMLKFAKTVKQYVPEVVLTVVDVIGEEAIEKSRAVAESIGVKFRVRTFS